MNLHHQDNTTKVIHGDCIETMNQMEPESVDAIVTDPPYGLGFMGKKWDNLPPSQEWAEACYRVLKPGGHIAAFGGTRTWHRLAVAIEDAGFEMRDSLAWLYGSGFPKSHNVGKSTAADEWDGWGTALKPAFEPIVLARKPLAEKTVARNVLAHGTGAINIDACRVTPLTGAEVARSGKSTKGGIYGDYGSVDWKRDGAAPSGRWPANVLLDQHTAAWVDEQSGVLKSPGNYERSTDVSATIYQEGVGARSAGDTHYGFGDTGGASRFFYTAKAPKSERPNVGGVQHPTVKPLAIMEWLIRLVTPPDGVLLDPFAGSGTTLEAARKLGHKSIGIEAEETYLPLIDQRLHRSNTNPIELEGIGE